MDVPSHGHCMEIRTDNLDCKLFHSQRVRRSNSICFRMTKSPGSYSSTGCISLTTGKPITNIDLMLEYDLPQDKLPQK